MASLATEISVHHCIFYLSFIQFFLIFSFHNLFIDTVSLPFLLLQWTLNLPDSWFAFCFAYSVENRSQRNRFIDSESSTHGRPPRLGWTDSGRVPLCNDGRPHSNTTQIFDNSIIIMDEGPRVDAGLIMICCSCHLVDLLFGKWVTVVMSISTFHCLESVELIMLKKPELKPTFSSLKANFATTDKKTTVILWQLL